MTREEAETKSLSEVATFANYLIGRAMASPFLTRDAKDMLSLVGVLVGRMANEIEALKGGAK